MLILRTSAGSGRTHPAFRLPQEKPTRQQASLVLDISLKKAVSGSTAEPLTVWVFFTDKGFTGEDEIPARISAYIATLPEKSVSRRLTRGAPFGFTDLPVHRPYLRTVERLASKIRHTSRWFNAVSIEAIPTALQEIASLLFVARIEPIPAYRSSLRRNGDAETQQLLKPVLGDSSFYGYSYEQLNQINVPAAHDAGYTGKGVVIAFFDTGFRTSHSVFNRINASGRLIAQHDFVFDDDIVIDEPEDRKNAHSHGTATWSLTGGYEPGVLVGAAYDAGFILAKTEDIRSETPVEEDNWVAAAEWAESLGADVISSSLAYLEFDDSSYNYSLGDLDGNTGRTTIAADLAVTKGVVVVSAMGNEGPKNTTLWMPADADYIISVGAVGEDGAVASFSSRGPTYDGRIKPELCARGVRNFTATSSGDSSYGNGNGTSVSTPLVTGAAALVIEAHPEWTPLEVRNALTETASHAAFPNNDLGWGIVDVLAAINYSGSIPVDTALTETIYLSNFYTNPIWFAGSAQGFNRIDFSVPDTTMYESGVSYSLVIYNLLGQSVVTLREGIIYPGFYTAFWYGFDEENRPVPSGIYFARLSVAGTDIVRKLTVLK